MSTEYNEPGTPIWQRTGPMHVQRYHFAARYVSGKAVLNIGCGPGYAEAILSVHRPLSILSADRDADLIKRLNENPPAVQTPVSYKQADACDLQSSLGTFDVAIAFELIEHLSDPVQFFEGLKRVRAASGMLVLISTPNALLYSKRPVAPSSNPYHVHEYEYDEFKGFLSKYLSDIQVFGQVERPSADIAAAVEVSLRSLNSLWIVRLERQLRRLLGRPLPDFYFLPQLTDVVELDARSGPQANTFLAVGRL